MLILLHTGGEFNTTTKTEFNISMNIYTSSSFFIVAEKPVTVTSNQPLYVGITETRNNVNYKFVVNRCYATPISDPKSPQYYLFFEKKCPLDRSFQLLSTQNNNRTFNFKIGSFNFIKLHKKMYFHCELFICHVDSMSDVCTQKCAVTTSRKRRAVNTDLPTDTAVVTSDEISLKEAMKTCKDLTCVKNAQCLELYPAQVFHFVYPPFLPHPFSPRGVEFSILSVCLVF